MTKFSLKLEISKFILGVTPGKSLMDVRIVINRSIPPAACNFILGVTPGRNHLDVCTVKNISLSQEAGKFIW